MNHANSAFILINFLISRGCQGGPGCPSVQVVQVAQVVQVVRVDMLVSRSGGQVVQGLGGLGVRCSGRQVIRWPGG